MFGGPADLARKWAILAEHCAAIGRPFNEIERSTLQPIGLGGGRSPGAGAPAGESPDAIVERFGRLADAGAQHVMVNFRDAYDVALIELLGSRVIPQIRKINAKTPLPGASLN
jgi:hypothetical protein